MPRIIPNPTAETISAQQIAGNPGDDVAFFHVGHNRVTGKRLTASISGSYDLVFYYGADLSPVDNIDVGEDFLCGELHITRFAASLIRFDPYLDRRNRQRANINMVWN